MTYQISTTWTVILACVIVWDLVWRGMALWRAARHEQMAWFVALLIINSVGVLPILYILLHREHGYRTAQLGAS